MVDVIRTHEAGSGGISRYDGGATGVSLDDVVEVWVRRFAVLAAGAFFMGCGHTPPDDQKRGGGDTGTGVVGHAPELVGFTLEFVEEVGLHTLYASARLGDVDDNLVPDGSVSAVLIDDEGRERTSLEHLSIGTPPSELPEPTHLRVEFGIADDPARMWEVRLRVTDRDGLSSEEVKAVWLPVEDTGG